MSPPVNFHIFPSRSKYIAGRVLKIEIGGNKRCTPCDFELRDKLSSALRHLARDSGVPAVHLAITAAKAIFLSSLDRSREKRRPFLSGRKRSAWLPIDRFSVSIDSQGANGLVSPYTSSERLIGRGRGRSAAVRKTLSACSTYTCVHPRAYAVACCTYVHVLRRTRTVPGLSSATRKGHAVASKNNK